MPSGVHHTLNHGNMIVADMRPHWLHHALAPIPGTVWGPFYSIALLSQGL